MAEDWVSLREFGRRHNLSLAAVQKAIETGRVAAVKRSPDGSRLKGIEANLAWQQWNANTDPAEAAKNGKTLVEVPDTPPATDSGGSRIGDAASLFDVQSSAAASKEAPKDPADSATAGSPGATKDPHGYQAARAQRERLEVKARELEYAKAIGLVVSVDDLRKVSERRYRAIRDQLLNVPDRICAALAAERDPAQVHALLTAELKQVLNGLADDAAAEAARGAAERLAA